jgi:tripartite-type tricarboxylate transporter receptor subunit TctC
MGIAAPPGTPKEIIGRISEAIRQAFNKPDIKARIEALDVEPRGTTPMEMRDLIRRSAERWTPLIKAAKISVD